MRAFKLFIVGLLALKLTSFYILNNRIDEVQNVNAVIEYDFTNVKQLIKGYNYILKRESKFKSSLEEASAILLQDISEIKDVPTHILRARLYQSELRKELAYHEIKFEPVLALTEEQNNLMLIKKELGTNIDFFRFFKEE